MSCLIRVGLLAARPVYYQAPLYRRVAGTPGIEFTAIFASTAGVRPMDGGYGQAVSWGAEVLEGYRSVFLNRAESNPEGGSTFALRDLDVVGLLGRSAFTFFGFTGTTQSRTC